MQLGGRSHELQGVRRLAFTAAAEAARLPSAAPPTWVDKVWAGAALVGGHHQGCAARHRHKHLICRDVVDRGGAAQLPKVCLRHLGRQNACREGADGMGEGPRDSEVEDAAGWGQGGATRRIAGSPAGSLAPAGVRLAGAVGMRLAPDCCAHAR